MCKDRIAELSPGRVSGTISHAEDESDIPAEHTEALHYHATDALSDNDFSFKALRRSRKKTKRGELGSARAAGRLPQDMVKYGVDDKNMSHALVGRSVLGAFQSVVSQFEA